MATSDNFVWAHFMVGLGYRRFGQPKRLLNEIGIGKRGKTSLVIIQGLLIFYAQGIFWVNKSS